MGDLPAEDKLLHTACNRGWMIGRLKIQEHRGEFILRKGYGQWMWLGLWVAFQSFFLLSIPDEGIQFDYTFGNVMCTIVFGTTFLLSYLMSRKPPLLRYGVLEKRLEAPSVNGIFYEGVSLGVGLVHFEGTDGNTRGEALYAILEDGTPVPLYVEHDRGALSRAAAQFARVTKLELIQLPEKDLTPDWKWFRRK